MTKTLCRFMLCAALSAMAACGSSKSTTGTGGNGGQGGNAGSSATAGTTGLAGSSATAGTTGSAGTTDTAGTTGTAGSDAAVDAPGTAGSDAGTNTDVAPQADAAPTTTNIKAATGGTVTAAGLTLEIPPGALAVDTDITVAVSDGATSPAAATLVASVYDLGPNGTTFLKPVKLTINVDAAKLGTKQAVVSYVAAGAWVALTDSMAAAGGKVVATTTHFTSFGVVGTDAAACVAMAKTACQACCKTTFAKGLNAPLDLAIKACGCKAGSPCETQCAGNVCASMAPTAACQSCLSTAGNAQPQSACITQSQADCVNDVDCKAYATCVTSCGSAPAVDASADSSTDAATDVAPACTVGFTDTAPAFTITKVATAVPAAIGGTIVPGTYWLTEQLDYTGPGGATGSTPGAYSETFQFTGTEWNLAATAGGKPLAFRSTYVASGTTFTVTNVCPAGAGQVMAYSVIGNEIHFQDVGGAVPSSARVLVRQP